MDVVEWVEDIDELAELFERQEGLGGRRVRGICGRVTKGRTEDDFRLLSDGPTKRYLVRVLAPVYSSILNLSCIYNIYIYWT
jgi:hypothetical protein